MNRLKTIFAAVLAITAAVGCMTSCSNKKNGDTSEETSAIQPTTVPEEIDETRNQTIYWLSDYDLNPSDGEARSVALSLFESVYGGKVEWIRTPYKDKYNILEQRILSQQPVDMFPFDETCLPYGVINGFFKPLDEFSDVLELDTNLWSDMRGLIDCNKAEGSSYVIPYSLSDPQLITYSRTMMKEEELDDPYELYLDGKWDYDTMIDMMKTFVENAPDKKKARYGVSGDFGCAALHSAGLPVVGCENGKLVNNIGSEEIAKAVGFMAEINEKKLYNSKWSSVFPTKGDTLFYAMGDWSLGKSNAQNPDADLMIVPFPKPEGAEKNHICCNVNAKMLVSNSEKGAAVAAYIKCERLAAAEETYRNAAKETALSEEKTASGELKSFVTEEQYEALMTYLDPTKTSHFIEFGCGMGEMMYSNGIYTYETKGIIDKLEAVTTNGFGAAADWDEFSGDCSAVINAQISRFNYN